MGYSNPEDAMRNGRGRKVIGDLYTPHKDYLVVYTMRGAYLAPKGCPGFILRAATTREVDTAVNWRNTMGDA